MKWTRFIVVTLVAVALASTVSSEVRAASSAKHEGSDAHAKSPEEMAKQALEKWKTTLKITDQQAPQFEAVMTDSYRKMSDAKTAAAGDKAKMQASMQTIMKDRDEALSKVLTPEQMTTYRTKLTHATEYAKSHKSHKSSEKKDDDSKKDEDSKKEGDSH